MMLLWFIYIIFFLHVLPATSSLTGTIFSPLNLGPPTYTCRYCRALFWYEERLNRRQNTSSPSYNTCCKEGSVILPPYKPPPEPLYSLLTGVNRAKSAHFFDNIRCSASSSLFKPVCQYMFDAIHNTNIYLITLGITILCLPSHRWASK